MEFVNKCWFTQKVEALEKRLLASPVHKNPELETLYNLCQKKAEVMTNLTSNFTNIFLQTLLSLSVNFIVRRHVLHSTPA